MLDLWLFSCPLSWSNSLSRYFKLPWWGYDDYSRWLRWHYLLHCMFYLLFFSIFGIGMNTSSSSVVAIYFVDWYFPVVSCEFALPDLCSYWIMILQLCYSTVKKDLIVLRCQVHSTLGRFVNGMGGYGLTMETSEPCLVYLCSLFS